MAKKGGTSEINGFIKTEETTKAKQKVSSKSSKKEAPEDKTLKPKRLTAKDSLESKKNRETSVTKVRISSKTKPQVPIDSSKVHKSSSNPPKVVVTKDPRVNKVKTADISQKTRTSTEQNSTRRATSQDAVKSKPIPSSTSQKTSSLTTNRNADKIQKVHSKNGETRTVSSDAQVKEKKSKLESKRAEVSKTSSHIKKTQEVHKTVEKNRTSKTQALSKSNNSSRTVDGPLSKLKTVKTSKSTTNEKEKKSSNQGKTSKESLNEAIRFSESVVTETKVELPEEDSAIKRNYKDLIYFEVDMGNAKRPVSSRTKSARIKSSTSHSSAVSRQGTFTKDDSPTSLESETQLMDQTVVNEEKSILVPEDNEEAEYEDDFEDYESDFEEYVSESDSESGLSSKSETDSEPAKIKSAKTFEVPKPSVKLNVKVIEEEKKLDSGNYDLASKPVLPQSVKQKQLDQIKEAISQENISMFDKRKKAISEKSVINENKVVVLDFVSAFKKEEEAEKARKEQKRSSMILNMIQLHVQNIDLFEDTFFGCDAFEDIHHNRNVLHAATQTDLILIEEETQTSEITIQNKWTQYPINYHQWSDSSFSFKTFMEDQRGYGGDNVAIDYNSWWNAKYSATRLYNFIDSASKVILIMMEEEAKWKWDEQKISITNPKDDLGFSDGCISIEVENIKFLKDRPICDIVFSPHDPNIFISSHRFIQNIEKLPYTDQFFGRSILCVWNILEPSQPLFFLVASCQICAVTFDLEYDNFVYAGLTDGSVCLWDLNESSIYHKQTTAGTMEYLLRTPTFCSSYLAGKDYHHNVIVSMKSLGYESMGKLSSQKFNPTQLLTLDADGKVVLWIVTRVLSSLEISENNIDKFDPGMSFWGKFKFVMGSTLKPETFLPSSETNWGLQYHCMSLAPEYINEDKINLRSILVGTNIGSIIHFYTSEDEIDVPVFSSETEENYAFSVMCIEKNPHGFPVFMAGCNDSRVRFYVLNKPKPIKIITIEHFECTPTNKIKWSPLGLGLFFALDKHCCLHFWDICKEDRTPQMSVSLKALQTAHFDVTCDKKFVYIGLTVQRLKIDIHRVKDKLVTKDCQQEKEIFKKFVKSYSNILDEES